MKDHLKDFVFVLLESFQQTNPIRCIHVQDIFSIRRFSQLIRTITSIHLIDHHHHHQENTNHQTKLASTMNLMENLDQSEEDERIK